MSSKTEVLLHFDESAIRDECGNIWDYSYNPNPNENISTFSKFGKGSLAFPCNIARQMEPTSCIYTQWFTVDFWVYLADYKYYYPLQILHSSMHKLECYINGAELDVFIGSHSARDISGLVSRGTIPVKKWSHIAIVRDNTTFYFFINGICTSTITNESRLIHYSSSNDRIKVGGMNSNMDEVRISTYPVWTKNFTPPTSSYDVIERHTLMTDKIDNYYGILKKG